MSPEAKTKKKRSHLGTKNTEGHIIVFRESLSAVFSLLLFCVTRLPLTVQERAGRMLMAPETRRAEPTELLCGAAAYGECGSSYKYSVMHSYSLYC